jgi:hypothetical protein
MPITTISKSDASSDNDNKGKHISTPHAANQNAP